MKFCYGRWKDFWDLPLKQRPPGKVAVLIDEIDVMIKDEWFTDTAFRGRHDTSKYRFHNLLLAFA